MKQTSPGPVRGFTLIEVMVTVAIVAILAGIAWPAYTGYARRGQLPEATALLSDYRIKMEQYFQDNRNYGTGNCATGAITPAWASFNASAKYFDFTCALDATNGYVISATGKSGTLTSGYDYTVTGASTLYRHTTKFKGATVSNKDCWLIKGDEC